MNEEQVASLVIRASIEVHKALGPGLLEAAYKECLYYELRQTGLNVEKEKPMSVFYKVIKLEQ